MVEETSDNPAGESVCEDPAAQEDYDVVIIGGGLVGLTLGSLLQQSHLKIAILESAQRVSSLESPASGYDISGASLSLNLGPRVSSLNPRSVKLLDRLGAWSLMPEESRCAFHSMAVRDSRGTGSLQFDSSLINQSFIGQIVDNNHLLAGLRTVVDAADRVDLIEGCKTTDICRDPGTGGMKVALIQQDQLGMTINTQLVVGADGANSLVREMMNLPLKQWSYGQEGFVTHILTEKNHESTARQWFTELGPLAFLPMNLAEGNVCSVVWSVKPVFADHLKSLKDDELIALLTEHSEAELGAVQAVSERFSFPLQARHANSYIDENIALIGDAAHTIHPLAGQGLNLGIADADELARALSEARLKGESLGNKRVLNKFNQQRRRENLVMMSAMEALKRLFDTDNADVNFVRNLGLKLVQNSSLFKQQFMRLASGELIR